MDTLKWDTSSQSLYNQIVERVPEAHRKLVASSLRRAAEARAAINPVRTVTQSEVIVGFFDATPKAFHSEVIANLESLAVDYGKYLTPRGVPTAPETNLEQLMRDVCSMCTLVGVPCDESGTWRAIQLYADHFRRAPVSMRTTNKPVATRDLCVRYLDLKNAHAVDPLTMALTAGLVANDGHPIFRLFTEAKQRCAAFGYGVDLNARLGFSKIWMAPSVDSASLDVVSELQELPPAARDSMAHFARFGLTSFGLLGFDFVHKSVNLYFMIKEAAGGRTRDYEALLTDLGCSPGQRDLLEINRRACNLYYSFSWDAKHTVRVCLSTVYAKPELVPRPLDPLIERCLRDPAFMNGQKKCIYSVAWSAQGHYFKLDNDYNGSMASWLRDAGDVGL